MPEAAMPNAPETFTIRPTLKPAAITLVFALACIGLAYWAYFTFVPEYPGWTPVLSFVTLAPAVLAWIDSKRISLSFDGEELRLQSGLFARQTKSLDIRLVRGARAERTLVQRLWNVGTLIVDADLADGRLEIRDVNAPARYARKIEAAAQAARKQESRNE
jgi:uncharacterized membrane protein YdbT with pleckstrin-like domain